MWKTRSLQLSDIKEALKEPVGKGIWVGKGPSEIWPALYAIIILRERNDFQMCWLACRLPVFDLIGLNSYGGNGNWQRYGKMCWRNGDLLAATKFHWSEFSDLVKLHHDFLWQWKLFLPRRWWSHLWRWRKIAIPPLLRNLNLYPSLAYFFPGFGGPGWIWVWRKQSKYYHYDHFVLIHDVLVVWCDRFTRT